MDNVQSIVNTLSTANGGDLKCSLIGSFKETLSQFFTLVIFILVTLLSGRKMMKDIKKRKESGKPLLDVEVINYDVSKTPILNPTKPHNEIPMKSNDLSKSVNKTRSHSKIPMKSNDIPKI